MSNDKTNEFKPLSEKDMQEVKNGIDNHPRWIQHCRTTPRIGQLDDSIFLSPFNVNEIGAKFIEETVLVIAHEVSMLTGGLKRRDVGMIDFDGNDVFRLQKENSYWQEKIFNRADDVVLITAPTAMGKSEHHPPAITIRPRQNSNGSTFGYGDIIDILAHSPLGTLEPGFNWRNALTIDEAITSPSTVGGPFETAGELKSDWLDLVNAAFMSGESGSVLNIDSFSMLPNVPLHKPSVETPGRPRLASKEVLDTGRVFAPSHSKKKLSLAEIARSKRKAAKAARKRTRK